MVDDIYANLPQLDFFDPATPDDENRYVYSIITTQDGSPTLAVWPKREKDFNSFLYERMHHPKGAWTETLMIYGQALVRMQAVTTVANVYVVGLGCGYIELMTVAHFLRSAHRAAGTIANSVDDGAANQASSQAGNLAVDLRIRSFESDMFLNEGFLSWLSVRAGTPAKTPRFENLYGMFDTICNLISQEFSVSADAIWTHLFSMHECGNFILEGALNPEYLAQDTPPFSSTALLYDAFSTKTNPYLWEEDFLSDMIAKWCAPNSIFGSYAAKGVLNRALIKNNFEIQKVQGFGGKRESTYGIRSPQTLLLTK